MNPPLPPSASPSNRPLPKVWIAGATGLVGRALLGQLLSRPLEVHALLRREAPELGRHPRLHLHRVNFGRPDLGPAHIPAPDEIYITLGTTIAAAGSQEAFREVDFEAVLHVARVARAGGARRCAVVSALGADPASRVFYNRVKGEMEQALKGLHFKRLVIARPSLLAGEREALGQARRPGERWGLRLMQPLGTLIPARWRPIQADTVARALSLALHQDGPAAQVLESDALQTLGAPT